MGGALRNVEMKPAIRGRQSVWGCVPLSLEGGREKSSLETLWPTLQCLTFEQDWTCLSKGEAPLLTAGQS